MYCYAVNGFPISNFPNQVSIPINRKSPLSESRLTEIHCISNLKVHTACITKYKYNICFQYPGPTVPRLLLCLLFVWCRKSNHGRVS